MKRLSIIYKMLLAPLASLFTLLLFGFFVLNQLHQNQEKWKHIQEAYLPVVQLNGENLVLFEEIVETFRDAVETREGIWIEEAERQKVTLLSNLGKLETIDSGRLRDKAEVISQTLINYVSFASDISTMYLSEQDLPDQVIEEKVPRMLELQQRSRELLTQLRDQELDEFNQEVFNNNEDLRETLIKSGTLIFFSLLIIVAIATLISRSIQRSIMGLSESVKELSEGSTDFSQRLEKKNDDELGQLVEGFNEFTHKLEADHNALKKAKASIEEKNATLESINNELQRLSKEKEELVGIAAHDLKNPLSGQMGLLEMLLDESSEHFTSEQREMLELVEISAKDMHRIISNLLEVNLIERNGVEVNAEKINPSAIFENVFQRYALKIKEKKQSIVSSIPDNISCFADPFLLGQILDNLVSNAIKYSPKGKTIWIECSADDRNVRFVVKDEGPGISMEDQKKLYGKYTRLSAKPTGGESSTGVGLSIVQKMVKAMSGTVTCKSQLGEGSSFIVELPVDCEK